MYFKMRNKITVKYYCNTLHNCTATLKKTAIKLHRHLLAIPLLDIYSEKTWRPSFTQKLHLSICRKLFFKSYNPDIFQTEWTNNVVSIKKITYSTIKRTIDSFNKLEKFCMHFTQ